MSSDTSSSPTTPAILTPESTGTSTSSPDAIAVKKSRRQTAFYPNATNKQKPFSRSAAKRESVMALGSIEHLQHYFTKTGIAAKRTHLHKPHYGLVPAIGGPENMPINLSLGSLQEFNLPPSPTVPSPPRAAFPPFEKTYETDPDSLLPGVIDDLSEAALVWKIGTRNDANLLGAAAFDVLAVLKSTTRAIRSTRNYVLSLPDESTGTLRAQFRSKLLAPNSHVPKRLVTPQSTDPLTIIRGSALQVLTVLRELEESSRVPLSDDAYDAQSDHSGGRHSRMASPISDEDGLATAMPQHEADAEPPVAFSFMRVQGRDESVPVWEDEVDVFDEEEEQEKREHWDDRLVLGGGWLYRQDVRLEDLGKQQDVIKGYLDAADEILFGGRKEGKRGWERERERLGRGSGFKAKSRRASAGGDMSTRERSSERRVVSMGMAEAMNSMALSEEPEQMEEISEEDGESLDEDELPRWAKRSEYIDEPLARVHAVLSNFLPADLLPHLPPASQRSDFLSALSSGQLLCVGYNACVRKSRKPWGYVNKDGIHDIFALERAERESGGDGKGKGKGWTFRRTDNLRLWAGALKLRYLLPLVVPSAVALSASSSSSSSTTLEPGTTQPLNLGNTQLPSPSPTSRIGFPSTETPIMFDARVVAKKGEGWEEMLERVLLKWVETVVDERRYER